MEYISSKNLSHADGLSRLIAKKHNENLEETVIAALKDKQEISHLLCNTVRELPVMLGDIRKAAGNDNFIKNMKIQTRINERNKKLIKNFSVFDLRKYANVRRVVMPQALHKKILKQNFIRITLAYFV